MSPTSITADDASWLDLFRGANALRVLVLAAGVALHAINLYLTTTILPSVVDDIGGVAFYAWNTTLFIVASITGAAVAAQVIQHAGPRGAYLLGAAVFGGGSALCALAPAMPVLLAGRVLQGLGGGVLLSAPIEYASAPVKTGLFAFGLVALLYLVTEELLVEAHEQAEDTPWITALFFVGFLVLLVLQEAIG